MVGLLVCCRTMQPGTALATTQGLEIPLASAPALFDNRLASQPSTHFDPLSLVEENRCECEVKYGRIAMLAAFGFPVTQQFTPAFNGDLPSNFHSKRCGSSHSAHPLVWKSTAKCGRSRRTSQPTWTSTPWPTISLTHTR